MPIRRIFLFILGLLALGAAYASPVKTDYVEAELVSEYRAIVAGQPAWIALRLKHDRHWHTYWRNPGDSGLPTKIEWKLPSGVTTGPIQWPTPQRIPLPPLANYGYEGEVLLLVELQVPAQFFGAEVKIDARADWLVCKDVCIPGGADLKLALPVVQGTPARDDRWARAFEASRAALPIEVNGWSFTATGRGDTIELAIKPAGGITTAPKSAYYFPSIEGLVEPGRAQTLSLTEGTLKLALPVANQLTAKGTMVDGVLVTDPPLTPGARGIALSGPLSGAIVAGPAPTHDAPRTKTVVRSKPEVLGGGSAEDLSLGLAILFALLGGIILNVMPCVFPILSIKILGFADQAHGDRRLMRMHGIAFGVGVVLSFLALASVLLALRGSGEALGWGFQLQSPWVVTALAVLFFLLALNLSGVFEILVPLPDAPVRPSHHPILGSFGAGILAAVSASPCTAPFMGAALGFAITQSAFFALVVFGALGLGMALPYMLLAWFPNWLKKLPRPGPWLARFKQFLAFPLYATVVWLVWVLGLQAGMEGVLRVGIVLVVLALAAWLWGLAQRGAGGWTRVVALLAVIASVVVAYPISTEPVESVATSAPTSTSWAPYDRAKIDDLTASGQAVFVDFTAAWCVTCQVNKRLVLETDAVRSLFAARKVALVRADWTRRDPVITEALAALGRNGVPVYVLYRPGKAPLVLPEILQRSTIEEALATL